VYKYISQGGLTRSLHAPPDALHQRLPQEVRGVTQQIWRQSNRVKVFTVDLERRALIPIENFAETPRSVAREITEERARSAE